MSLGQSVLAILALVVITFLVVSANRIITQSLQDELKGEAYNQAGEIASELINEALRKKFDDPSFIHYANKWVYIQGIGWKWFSNYKLYDFYQDTTDFTWPRLLGPENRQTGFNEKTAVLLPDRYPYQSIVIYDDFDDYNGYQRIVDTPVMTGFVVNCSVSYVAHNNMNTPVFSRTYYKLLLVKVTQPTYLTDTLSFSTVMTY